MISTPKPLLRPHYQPFAPLEALHGLIRVLVDGFRTRLGLAVRPAGPIRSSAYPAVSDILSASRALHRKGAGRIGYIAQQFMGSPLLCHFS